jgi:tetratricopeptide (TPR) repeat protein
MGWFKKTQDSRSGDAGRAPFFRALSLEERRTVLDTSEFVFRGVLRERAGELKVVHSSPEFAALISRLTDDDLVEAAELARLSQLAHHEPDLEKSIALYQQIVERAPFDSISLMSIGVQYRRLGQRRLAVRYLERALATDPDNERIRRNLDNVRSS